jgi:hypothetical protein
MRRIGGCHQAERFHRTSTTEVLIERSGTVRAGKSVYFECRRCGLPGGESLERGVLTGSEVVATDIEFEEG